MTSPIIGLKDLHYAKLLTDTSIGATYDVPKKLAAAIDAKISVATNSATLYGDDAPIVTSNSIGEITVELEVDALDNAEVQALLGVQKDANGVLKFNANDIAPSIALGFKSKKANGKYKFMWILKGTAKLPEDQFHTGEDQVTFQTKKLSLTFIVRQDGNWKFEVDEDDTGIGAGVTDGWFTEVYEPSAGAGA